MGTSPITENEIETVTKERSDNSRSEHSEYLEEATSLSSRCTTYLAGRGTADRRPSLAAQIFRPIGWLSIATGLILIEFAAFLFWGTGMKTAAAQTELRREFAQLREASVETHFRRPVSGEPIARLMIPKLGLDFIVVEGVGHEELMRGPGHIPETAFPGSDGSSVISGHRTTYAAPFAELDKLEPGDEIHIATIQGESLYVVTKSYIVLPVDTSVTLPLAPGERPRLRLTTCHPRFSATFRLVVEADRLRAPFR